LLFGWRDDGGGGFKARRDLSLLQRQIEGVGEPANWSVHDFSGTLSGPMTLEASVSLGGVLTWWSAGSSLGGDAIWAPSVLLWLSKRANNWLKELLFAKCPSMCCWCLCLDSLTTLFSSLQAVPDLQAAARALSRAGTFPSSRGFWFG